MKKRITTAMVAGLLFAGGTLQAAPPVPMNATPQVAPAGTMQNYGYGPCFDQGQPGGKWSKQSKGKRGGQQAMMRALNMTPEQATKMQELRQDFLQKTSSVRQELFRLKGELASASIVTNVDRGRIQAITARIGQQHVRMAELQSNHFQQMAGVLDKQQIDTMLKMKQNRQKGPRI